MSRYDEGIYKKDERWGKTLRLLGEGPNLLDEIREHAAQGRYVLIAPDGSVTVGTWDYVVRHLHRANP